MTRPVRRFLPWLFRLSTIGFFMLLASCVSTQTRPTVVAGEARFEFLTPSLVRMEYSLGGKFVDAPTAVVQKRNWPAVNVQSTQSDGWMVAKTGAMTLRYKLHSGPFSASNLIVSWNGPAGGAVHDWHPGDVDARNLGGLTYSLDNISAPNLPKDGKDLQSPVNDMIPGIEVLLPPAKPGLLSRNGYALIDDSTTPLWNAHKAWIEPRQQKGGQDWYLFTYGDDYQNVLKTYAALCGPVPMIPRYTLGAWITDFNFEYFPDSAEAREPVFQRYNTQHLKEEISRLRSEDIPFDGLVLDFAWHNYGWDGGFDWSPLVPHPKELIDWLHGQGIKLSLNDHPGYANTEESIVAYQDSHAPAALEALGQPLPRAPSFEKNIPNRWQFASDPKDQGVTHEWFAKDSHAHWTTIKAGESWEAQGRGKHLGIAWYRTSVRLPAQLPDALYLVFGEVASSYRLYVNGREIPHSEVQWPQRVTYADVAPHVQAGRDNTIVLRVVGSKWGSGLLGTTVALRDVKPPPRIYFDLSDKRQADISMQALHKPLLDQGMAFWWVDGGSGAVDMPGLNKQLWTNKVFYDATEQATGKRGFILSRYGDWGSERYPAYFTGDTYSEWPVLAYEVAYTTRAGNVLVPYVSHDIGGFHGAKIDFDLYARWIEFGTFSPILRMHSAHANPREGNTRMPWLYGKPGIALMKKYFTLRTQLIPYLYSASWQAHAASMPIMRPLYLIDPKNDEAYEHPHEYFYGDQMLVAPVLDPGGNVTIYLPPGKWFDFFTGKAYDGGSTFNAHYAVDETPVFARDGAIVPEQPPSAYSDAKPLDRLILDVYGNGKGHFDLYEDDGVSLAYANNAYTLTPMDVGPQPDGSHRLIIGAAKGTFDGQVQQRAYALRIHSSSKPRAVELDGRVFDHWSWDATQSIATLEIPQRTVRVATTVDWTSDAVSP
ncbi:TIM-barrel domain-containing protein [Rhodanobacter sp. L36]|uniref:glycoside hydrolase family 31 protein n=1 Tax=Rhodanobacter sp. L36 TaxID=1747221 RepID=UPI00131A9D14|nr:TIM-barrel domain-containing protein [Rhodanobacter sp. L36]